MLLTINKKFPNGIFLPTELLESAVRIKMSAPIKPKKIPVIFEELILFLKIKYESITTKIGEIKSYKMGKNAMLTEIEKLKALNQAMNNTLEEERNKFSKIIQQESAKSQERFGLKIESLQKENEDLKIFIDEERKHFAIQLQNQTGHHEKFESTISALEKEKQERGENKEK